MQCESSFFYRFAKDSKLDPTEVSQKGGFCDIEKSGSGKISFSVLYGTGSLRV
jgi:hypothetical protein